MDIGNIFLAIFKSMMFYLLAFVLVLGNVLFVTPVLFSQIAQAEEPAPNCMTGNLVGDNSSSTFQVVLSCTNVVKFINSGGVEANSADWVRISLQTEDRIYNPSSAIIASNQLALTFSNYGGTAVRNININADTFLNSSGVSNSVISIATGGIADYATPYSNDDYYSVIGTKLDVTATSGVLSNDIEAEGIIGYATVVSNPLYGTLIMNLDGSFIYTPTSVHSGSDTFTYSAKDNADNISNVATVTISDAAPVVTANFYRQSGIGEAGYAKVGDTLRVDFETNEQVVVDNVIIGGHSVPSYSNFENNHYYSYYVMQESDSEGIVKYSITVHDLAGNSTTAITEIGITFDKTKPVITLNDAAVMELEIHDDYFEAVTATDNKDGTINVAISGSVNTSIVGSYGLIYNATDKAGNQAETMTRTVNVIDSINDYYKSFANSLDALGFANNLSMVTMENATEFPGLYIEKSISGVKMGRITFDDPLDLSNFNMDEFLSMISRAMYTDKPGVIGLDLTGIYDNLALLDASATIKFYGLDRLGYSNSSTSDEVFARLNAFDDEGNTIDKLTSVSSPGYYIGCSLGQIECYTFTIGVNHFSKYAIGINNVKPKAVVVNYIPESFAVSDFKQTASNNYQVVPDISEVTQEAPDTPDAQIIQKSNIDKLPAAVTSVNNSWIMFGLAWYWWLLIIAATASAGWIVSITINRRNN